MELLERFQPVHAGHIVIDRDQVEGLAARECDALGTAFGNRHRIAMARERARGEPPQPRIVIDIQDRRWGGSVHPSVSGTWITDRNSPSWRIAWAKLS